MLYSEIVVVYVKKRRTSKYTVITKYGVFSIELGVVSSDT